MSERRVSSAIRSLVNDRGLQFECAGVLHESLLMPVLMYDSEARNESLGLGLYRWTTSEVCWVSG